MAENKSTPVKTRTPARTGTSVCVCATFWQLSPISRADLAPAHARSPLEVCLKIKMQFILFSAQLTERVNV